MQSLITSAFDYIEYVKARVGNAGKALKSRLYVTDTAFSPKLCSQNTCTCADWQLLVVTSPWLAR